MTCCKWSIVALAGVVGVGSAVMLGGAGRSEVAAQPDTKAAAPAASARAAGFKIDPVHSSVIFGVRHLGVSNFYGRFNDVAGAFHLDTGDLAKSYVDVTIKATSVDTANAGRDKHVRSTDFLAAEKHTDISFRSSGVKRLDDNAFEVAGTLSFRGVEKPITVKVEKIGEGKGMRGGTIAGIECRFSIKRSDYGNSEMTNAISDEVTFIFSVEGAKP